MNEVVECSFRFFDASAAVKLVASEVGSDAVRSFFGRPGPFYITPPCAVEVLSVLKGKHFNRGELDAAQYFYATYGFLGHLRDRLKLRGGPIEDHDAFWQAYQLVEKHKVDLIDALQLHTVLSQKLDGTMLITADEALATAARAEGLSVWDCIRESQPA